MAITNLDALTLEGALVAGGEITPAVSQAIVKKLHATIAFGDMTQVTTTLTYEFTEDIPIGAIVLRCALSAPLVGFAGDTSATVTVGDGSDVDRYMAGTPNVFADIAGGLDLGAPAGVYYHAAAKTPTVIVTTNADASNVTAGSMIVEIYYVT